MALAALVRWVAPVQQQVALGRIVALAFALRVAVALSIYLIQHALGRGGFFTGDDITYAKLAWGYAQWLQGTPLLGVTPPAWDGLSTSFGLYIYLTAGLYFLIGLEVVVAEILNCIFATAAIVLLWDICRRVFGPRPAGWAAALMAVLPSALLFSALNIKDALGLLVLAVSLWALTRFVEAPRWRWIVSVALGIELMRGVRMDIAVVLIVVLVVACAVVALRDGGRRGYRWFGAGMLLAAALSFNVLQGVRTGGSSDLFSLFEAIRAGMSAGRTGFVVEAPSSSSMALAAGYAAQAQVELANPSVAIGVPPPALDQTPLPDAAIGLVQLLAVLMLVRAAWWVGNRWPATDRLVLWLSVASFAISFVFFIAGAGSLASIGRTVAYVPKGLLYVLLSPFPWAATTTLDRVAIPETLAWWAVLCAGAWTLVRRRERWPLALPLAAFAIVTIALFVLTEGNVGTLIRHRTMNLAPVVIVFSAPAFVRVWDALRRGRLARGQDGGASSTALPML